MILSLLPMLGKLETILLIIKRSSMEVRILICKTIPIMRESQLTIEEHRLEETTVAEIHQLLSLNLPSSTKLTIIWL